MLQLQEESLNYLDCKLDKRFCNVVNINLFLLIIIKNDARAPQTLNQRLRSQLPRRIRRSQHKTGLLETLLRITRGLAGNVLAGSARLCQRSLLWRHVRPCHWDLQTTNGTDLQVWVWLGSHVRKFPRIVKLLPHRYVSLQFI